MTPRPGLLDRLRGALDVLVREAAKFGVVGLVAFVVDTALYNYLVFGLPGGGPDGPLHDIPLRAKILATSVAMVVAWLGNRYWTFRHRRRAHKVREFALYVVFNVIGLGIAVACLGFSRYVLGLDSQLADNISANGVGLVLGTLIRFWAYRTYVFRGEALADIEVPLLHPHHDPDPQPPRTGENGQRAGAIET